MIRFIYEEKDNDENQITRIAETIGCGCCSESVYNTDGNEDIIIHIKENIEIAKEACKRINIDFNDILKDME